MPNFSTYGTSFKSSYNFKNEKEKVEHFNKCFKKGDKILFEIYGEASLREVRYCGFVRSSAFVAGFASEPQESENQTDWFAGSIAMVKVEYFGKSRFIPLDSISNWYGKLEEAEQISTEEMLSRR